MGILRNEYIKKYVKTKYLTLLLKNFDEKNKRTFDRIRYLRIRLR